MNQTLPDWSGVLFRRWHQLERLQVPEVDGLVLRGRGQQELVRVELDVVDGAGMLVELRHQLAGPEVPNLEIEKESVRIC